MFNNRAVVLSVLLSAANIIGSDDLGRYRGYAIRRLCIYYYDYSFLYYLLRCWN